MHINNNLSVFIYIYVTHKLRHVAINGVAAS
jgi:hypothetical protein